MKTKEQKKNEVDIGNDLVKKSKSLILVNFSNIPVNSINELKAMLRSIEAKIRVMKKTLFSIIFKNNGIDIDAKDFSGQVATIFSDSDIADTSSVIYKFSKSHSKDEYTLNMIAGYDMSSKDIYNADKMTELGKLPSRDVLLAQLSGVLSAPIRVLAIAIKEVATKINEKKNDIVVKNEKSNATADEDKKDIKSNADIPNVDKEIVNDEAETGKENNNNSDSDTATDIKDSTQIE